MHRRKKTQTHKCSVSQELVPVRHLRISHNSPPQTPLPQPPQMANRDLEASTLKDCLHPTRTFDLGLEDIAS